MAKRDLTDIIDERVNSRTRKKMEGTVIAVSYNTARVQPKGSTALVPCDIQVSNVAVGKLVTMEWIPGRKRRVITSVYDAQGTISQSTTSTPVTYPQPPESAGGSDGFPTTSHFITEARVIPTGSFLLMANYMTFTDPGSLDIQGELFFLELP